MTTANADILHDFDLFSLAVIDAASGRLVLQSHWRARGTVQWFLTGSRQALAESEWRYFLSGLDDAA